MKKLLLLLLVLAVAVMAGWGLYRRVTGSDAAKKPARSAVAVAVETQPIRKGPIDDVGVFTGSLEPKSQFIVASKVAGWLRELLVGVGDTVTRNQAIAVLDDEEFAQEVEQAQAELQVAKANAANCASDLDIAKREYERAKALREKQIASASQLDVSEAAFNACETRHKVSLAQVSQRQAALKTALVRLSYTKVHAFWEEGDQTRVVGERFVDEGALLQMNQPIVSILQNNPLTAVVYVIERDYPKVTIGQQAVVTTDAYPGRMFTGGITRIAPLLKESSRQARVEVDVPNPDLLLRPGMFIRARVEFARHENATLIPLAALVRRDNKEGIFIADMQTLKARFVPVTAGITSGELVEITEPEISGEAVTIGNHLLEDGSGITVPGSDSRGTRNEGRGTSDEAFRKPQPSSTGSQTSPATTRAGGSR
jgi:RND family efflux transporter MFP subunit